jgi:hypothetical protein
MTSREKNISIAIESLEETKREVEMRCKRETAELDRTIANLRQLLLSSATLEKHPAPTPTPGSWEGMGIPDAVHAFLANHAGPVRFCDLMSGLMESGVKLGDVARPQRYEANVKSTLTLNRRRFSYNKAKDTVKLLQRTKPRNGLHSAESESEQAAG